MINDYRQKLKHPIWQKKKNRILERDEYTCKMCGSHDHTLNVHHFAYAPFGFEPWDVPNSALITFCEDCHANEERNKRVFHQQLLRTFGFCGYSNSDIEELTKLMVPVFELDTDLFREKMKGFVEDFVKEQSDGK